MILSRATSLARSDVPSPTLQFAIHKGLENAKASRAVRYNRLATTSCI